MHFAYLVIHWACGCETVRSAVAPPSLPSHLAVLVQSDLCPLLVPSVAICSPRPPLPVWQCLVHPVPPMLQVSFQLPSSLYSQLAARLLEQAKYEKMQVGVHACTVHDTENLTFPTDDHADNPQVAVQPSAYVRVGNQWISRGHLEDSARTISGFRVEQLANSVRNSVDVTQRLPKAKTYCLHS